MECFNNTVSDYSEIRIEELNVYAYHGVYAQENEKGQNFYINATLIQDTRQAGKSDNLELSTNYGEVCEFINDWMKGHTFKLIETVAEKMAGDILCRFPLVRAVELEIRKPEAPIKLAFESVSVCIKRSWHTAYIAAGSNMGDRRTYIDEAMKQLGACSHTKVTAVSDIISTKPYGGVEQDDFLNAVAEIETLLTPGELLKFLHEIEQNAGRERLIHWGPRTLDLDIVFYDKLIYEDNDLIIPHVDMENRDFVLRPMCMIAPNFRHPILNKTMRQLLDELGK